MSGLENKSAKGKRVGRKVMHAWNRGRARENNGNKVKE